MPGKFFGTCLGEVSGDAFGTSLGGFGNGLKGFGSWELKHHLEINTQLIQTPLILLTKGLQCPAPLSFQRGTLNLDQGLDFRERNM